MTKQETQLISELDEVRNEYLQKKEDLRSQYEKKFLKILRQISAERRKEA